MIIGVNCKVHLVPHSKTSHAVNELVELRTGARYKSQKYPCTTRERGLESEKIAVIWSKDI